MVDEAVRGEKIVVDLSTDDAPVDGPPAADTQSHESVRKIKAAVAAILGVAIVLSLAEVWRSSRVPEPLAPPDSALAAMLRAMPGSDGADGRPLTGRVRFIDIDRLAEAAGVERPAVDAPDDVVGAWTEATGLADLGVFGPLWPQTSVARWHEDLGFYAHEVTFYAGTSDSTSYFKVLTDSAEIERRLRAPSEWSNDLRVDTYLGFDYFDWDRARESPCSRRDRNLRTLGRLSGCGGQLAIIGDLVIHASEIGSMRRALAAIAGVVPSRADVGASARLLIALDDLPIVTSDLVVFENILPDDRATGESLGYAWTLVPADPTESAGSGGLERVVVVSEADERQASRYAGRMKDLAESSNGDLAELEISTVANTVTVSGIPDDRSVVTCCFGPLKSPFDPDWFPS